VGPGTRVELADIDPSFKDRHESQEDAANAFACIAVEHLEDLGLTCPKPTVDLERIRREYHAAKHAAGS
jgi:hypothetical protein